MTPFIAATTTAVRDRDVGLTDLPWGWVLLGLIGWAVWYGVHCWVWPFKDCPRCEGAGHHRPKGKNGKRARVSRPCRRCKSKGKLLRFGRKVWNRFARVRNAAK